MKQEKQEKRGLTEFLIRLVLLCQVFFLVSWRIEASVQHAETMAAIHALDLARQRDNEDRLHNQLEGLRVKRAKAVLPNWTASDEAEFRRKGDLR